VRALLRRALRPLRETERNEGMNDGLTTEYSLALGLKKAAAGGGTVIVALLPALIDPLIAYFSTDTNVSSALQAVNPKLLAFAPLIAAGIRLIANYRKQAKAQ
jgi:hypothetical protein